MDGWRGGYRYASRTTDSVALVCISFYCKLRADHIKMAGQVWTRRPGVVQFEINSSQAGRVEPVEITTNGVCRLS